MGAEREYAAARDGLIRALWSATRAARDELRRRGIDRGALVHALLAARGKPARWIDRAVDADVENDALPESRVAMIWTELGHLRGEIDDLRMRCAAHDETPDAVEYPENIETRYKHFVIGELEHLSRLRLTEEKA